MFKKTLNVRHREPMLFGVAISLLPCRGLRRCANGGEAAAKKTT